MATKDWHSSGPLSFISGAKVTNLDPSDMTADEVIEVLREAARKGHPTVLSTDKFEGHPERICEGERLNLIGFHAYSVAGVTRDGRIRLLNPWGTQHPRRAIKGEEFKRLFMCAHIGQF